jgi:membrane fusion protein (multidrug efflux system)
MMPPDALSLFRRAWHGASLRSRSLRAEASLGRGMPALCIAFALLGAIAGCGDGAAGPGAERATPVVVGSLSREPFSEQIEAIGTALANESVVITAQVTERVQRVLFQDGQTVAKGDVLVELTNAQQSAQLAEVRANYTEAERQRVRLQELVSGGSESRARLEQQSAARDAAAARLRELEARLSDHLIKAPFAGVLGLREVSPGTLVKPGDTVTTLDDISTVKVDFSVPESFLSVLQAGLPIEAVSAAWPDARFAGTLTAVDTRIDPRTRAVRARAEIPNPDHRLRPGMLLAIQLQANPRIGLAVPEQALIAVGEKHYAFVVGPEDRAKRVEVVLGRRRPGIAEVVAGLTGAERLIVDGADLVREGGLVRVANPVAADVPKVGEAPATPAAEEPAPPGA